MKFAEHLSAHITPEWRKQYINYEVRIFQQALLQNRRDIISTVIQLIYRDSRKNNVQVQDETLYFRIKCLFEQRHTSSRL